MRDARISLLQITVRPFACGVRTRTYSSTPPTTATMLTSIICFLALGQAAAGSQQELPKFVATRLRADGSDLTNGDLSTIFAIDNPQPRFTWSAVHPERGETQTKFQIVVKEYDTETSFEDMPATWDSGMVASSASSLRYPATATKLKSDTKYVWTVRLVDSKQRLSEASLQATFRMALIGDSEWDGVEWISEPDLNMMRSEFFIEDPSTVKSAVVYVCGLGYSSVRLNGAPAAANLLTTAPWTNNDRRNGYSTFDVTSLLHKVTLS